MLAYKKGHVHCNNLSVNEVVSPYLFADNTILKRMACGSNIGNRTTENAGLMESLGLHSTHGRDRERVNTRT